MNIREIIMRPDHSLSASVRRVSVLLSLSSAKGRRKYLL